MAYRRQILDFGEITGYVIEGMADEAEEWTRRALDEGDLPPMFIPLVMLVRQAQGRDRGALQFLAPVACSPTSCVV